MVGSNVVFSMMSSAVADLFGEPSQLESPNKLVWSLVLENSCASFCLSMLVRLSYSDSCYVYVIR